MKKLVIIALIAAIGLFSGCTTTTNTYTSSKPVTPEQFSTESSNDGEPQLPYMTPWWKYQQ